MSDLVAIKTNPCPVCDKWSTVIVDSFDYGDWISGVYIQDAFPYLSSSERELLMTGTHDECWDEMFAPTNRVVCKNTLDWLDDAEV